MNYFPELEEAAERLRRDARMGEVDRYAALTRHLDQQHGVRVQVVPTVEAVCLPISGTGRFHCYISIDKRCEGEPKLAAMAAFTGGAVAMATLLLLGISGMGIINMPSAEAAIAATEVLRGDATCDTLAPHFPD